MLEDSERWRKNESDKPFQKPIKHSMVCSVSFIFALCAVHGAEKVSVLEKPVGTKNSPD